MHLAPLAVRALAAGAFATAILSAQIRVKDAILKEDAIITGERPSPLNLQLPEQGRKSDTLAIVYSLVLPGLGNLYAENFSTGKYYVIAEAGLWVTYAGFRLHGRWLGEDARAFASQHSNAIFDGKDDQYEVNIGNFGSLEEYNEAKLRNRQYDQLYDVRSSYGWQWDSDESRVLYKDLRIRKDESYRNSQFVIGALVLNRIIAAFSAARAVSAYNRAAVSQASWWIEAKTTGGILTAHGIELRLTKEF